MTDTSPMKRYASHDLDNPISQPEKCITLRSVGHIRLALQSGTRVTHCYTVETHYQRGLGVGATRVTSTAQVSPVSYKPKKGRET